MVTEIEFPRTDGFSYTKLSGSLLHGDEHDVAYAHDAAQQGETSG